MTIETESRTPPDVEAVAQTLSMWRDPKHPEECLPEARAILALLTPRAISTPAERAALPAGTVVRSASGTIACRHHDENVGVLFGMSTPFKWSDLSLPLTVLHLPA